MFKKFFANKNKFSALEIEEGFIKFAQAEDYGRRRNITKLTVKELPSQSEKSINAVLKGILQEVNGEFGHLTISIPRNKVTVRFLRFPSLNQKEITGMVELQSAKELPFHKEKIISDYLITEQTEDGYTRVALVIVHRDVVSGYLDILKKARIEPQRITFSTEAISVWFGRVFASKNLKDGSLLVDMDAYNTDIAIFYDSCLDFARGLSFGSRQMQNLANFRNELVQEIKRTIEGYSRAEKTREVQRLFLVAPAKLAENLRSFLEESFNLPCEVIKPFENLPHCKGPVGVQCKSETSLLKVLGMLLDVRGRKLNLMPAFVREKQRVKSRRKRVFRNSILVLAVILLGAIIFAKKIHDKQLRLLYLDSEIRRTQAPARDVEDMLKKVELIESRGKIEGSSVEVLSQLHRLSPRDIALSGFSYDEDRETVVLQGFCPDMSEIFKFVNILEKSASFKNVQLKYVSEKKASAGGTNFKIECSLEK